MSKARSPRLVLSTTMGISASGCGELQSNLLFDLQSIMVWYSILVAYRVLRNRRGRPYAIRNTLYALLLLCLVLCGNRDRLDPLIRRRVHVRGDGLNLLRGRVARR